MSRPEKLPNLRLTQRTTAWGTRREDWYAWPDRHGYAWTRTPDTPPGHIQASIPPDADTPSPAYVCTVVLPRVTLGPGHEVRGETQRHLHDHLAQHRATVGEAVGRPS